jgi:hypothetical protein
MSPLPAFIPQRTGDVCSTVGLHLEVKYNKLALSLLYNTKEVLLKIASFLIHQWGWYHFFWGIWNSESKWDHVHDFECYEFQETVEVKGFTLCCQGLRNGKNLYTQTAWDSVWLLNPLALAYEDPISRWVTSIPKAVQNTGKFKFRWQQLVRLLSLVATLCRAPR